MRKAVRGGSDERVENWLGGAGESGPEGRPSNTVGAGSSALDLLQRQKYRVEFLAMGRYVERQVWRGLNPACEAQ